jgi:O-antigen/teichoic acid export membrane protein
MEWLNERLVFSLLIFPIRFSDEEAILEPAPATSTPVARGRHVQEIAGVTLVNFLGQASWLVTVFLLARHLSRESFGYLMLWQYALNLLGAGALLGFQNAVLRRWPRERLAHYQWHSLFRPLGVLACVTAVLISIVFHFLYHSPIRDAICLFIAGSAIGFSFLPVTLLQIFRKYSLAQFLYTSWRPALLIATLLLIALGSLSVPHVILTFAVSGVLQLAGTLLATGRAQEGKASIPIRPMIPDAVAFTGLHMAALLSLRLDSFTMPKLLNLDALGLYSAASVWALTGYQLAGMALGQVLNPKLASAEPVPIRKLVLIASLVGAAAGGLLIALSGRVLPLAFGPQYVGDHRSLVALLALAGLLQTLYVFPSSRIGILASRPRLYGFAGLSFLSIGIGFLFLFLLVPRFGITGAAGAAVLIWAWRTGTAWWISARDKSGSVIDGETGSGLGR